MSKELLFCKDCEYAKYRPDIREGFWFCWKHKRYITQHTVINSYDDDRECKDYRERK